jgi:F5/8 type C domain
MNARPGRLARWRSGVLAAAVVGFLAVWLGGATLMNLDARDADLALAQERRQLPAGTPVASEPTPVTNDPLDGVLAEPEPEPLDGDPLDGAPRDVDQSPEDEEAPQGQQQLEILRSGRPNAAPQTLPAYDDDPETIWTPDSGDDATWVWFDLGYVRRVSEVRWLGQGTGTIELAVSNDPERWRDVDRVDLRQGWQGISLRADAQYVRLTLLPHDDGQLPALAEVTILGPEDQDNAALEQEQNADDQPRPRQRDRASRDTSASRQEAADDATADERQRGNGEASGRVQISTEPGETDCKGKRARCRAREGKVRVVEDCTESGSCTIDVQADGGTATCDTSGGDNVNAGETATGRDGRRGRNNASREQDATAGEGEGNRGGRGGRCEATADGGAVTIGDINP